MAKITNPLFSQSAGGALGRAIIFGQTNGSKIAKRWHQPTGAASAAQIARRNAYSAAVDAWALLSSAEKTAWAASGNMTNITGFNAFISDTLLNNPPTIGVQWEAGAGAWDGGAAIWID